jgi:hypothetical protein
MAAIDDFKQENTNWRVMSPYDIGKKFGADYVIDVEIDVMELYKPGSGGDFLQGSATINVCAFDISKPIKDPAYKKPLTFQYPRISEIPVESRSRSEVSTFRMAFVQHIATEIAVKFTASPADYRRQIQ